MLDTASRSLFDDTHDAFRDTVRRVVGGLDHDRFEREGMADRAAWCTAGEAGLLCPGVPEAYGGLGLDFTFNAIIFSFLSLELIPFIVKSKSFSYLELYLCLMVSCLE